MLTSHFPRRIFSRAQGGVSLEALGLQGAATLFVLETDDQTLTLT